MPDAADGSFSTSETQLAGRLKALGHPARLAILTLLAERDKCICGEIVDDLPLAQSTVSQHLKALKEVGLVQGSIEGRRTCYCLNKKTLSRLEADVQSFFEGLPLSFDRC